MKPFIRAIEIWVPSTDHLHLQMGDSIYGKLSTFRDASKARRFAYDEGLPGKAWSTGHPIVLPSLEGTCFLRAEEAKQAGLSSAVAMPIFSGEFIKAVIVFFCGDDDEHFGAIEVWHCDTRESYDLRLMEGYFGSMDLFRFLSENTSFRKGTGLPGVVWEQNMPVILSDLGQSHSFIRNQDAQESGVTSGLGIPCSHEPEKIYVMDFLSARGTPIARRMEIWALDPVRHCLAITSSYDEQGRLLVDEYARLSLGKGEGAIGRVWLSGIPGALEGLENDESFPISRACEAGLHTLLAIPYIRDGQLQAIVTLYN